METKKGSHNCRSMLITAAVLAGLAAVLLFAAKHAGGFAQWYSVNVYSLITESIGRFSGVFPFSLSEVLVILLPPMIIADFIRCRKRLRTAMLHLLLTASVLFFLYAASCGVNYYREPFVDPAALEKAVFTEEQLGGFCEYIVSQLNESCSAEDDSAEHPEGKELAASAVSSMHRLSEEYPSLRGYYPRPKQIAVIAGAFSAMGVSGIYSPFTVEANINGQIPDIEKPFTACHELSHLRGYMIEGEANYIGWLVCTGSDDPAFRRSGWLIAWMHAGGSLRRVDPEHYERLRAELPPEALAGLDEISLFWASHETGASEVQDRINDAYLRANGLESGIQSYGMLTTMMLMWYYD